ncbi:hypothetical protein [Lentzea sp. NPDC051838]|uniref:hypothetical protein n=1 Tax=Lentzea sp. NPDC051838 TaxID=3154849 RepID=UPI00344851FF
MNKLIRSIATAATIAAATSAFTLVTPASAAPSAGECATQLGRASNPLSLAAYAVEFGAEQGPFEHHEFIYTDLESARTNLRGGQCAGLVSTVKADVDFALARIATGESALRAGDWASSFTALDQADKAVSSAYYKAWKIAHP